MMPSCVAVADAVHWGGVTIPDWDRPEFAPHLPVVADLVYQAFPEFYQLFSANRKSVLDCLVAQLREPRSELGLPRLMLLEGRVAGVYCQTPTADVSRRRMISFRRLLAIPSGHPNASAAASAFGAKVQPLPHDSIVLARIAVSPDFRGQGLGKRLLHAFVAEGRRLGFRRVYSQVAATNTASLHMHESLGFTRVSGWESFDHLTLERITV